MKTHSTLCLCEAFFAEAKSGIRNDNCQLIARLCLYRFYDNYQMFELIFGYIGAPIVWLMGVCKEDMFLVGQLLGEKTILNE